MRQIQEAVELTDKEKLLLFYLLNPTLKFHFGAFKEEAQMIVAALGEERLEAIVNDLNETIFDDEIIKNLADGRPNVPTNKR